MHNVEKWPKILKKVCGVYTARVLNYVRPFFNIMHERFRLYFLNLLRANSTKWSNTLKQFVGKSRRIVVKNCLSLFDHFVGLALKDLTERTLSEVVMSRHRKTFKNTSRG